MAFREDFRKKIFEIVFDRLIVGAIVGVVVYFATVQIEKNKADNAFQIAINQMRVQKIAEIWEEAAKLEERFNELYEAVDRAAFAIEIMEGKNVSNDLIYEREEVALAAKEFENACEAFYKKVRLYRFYLGTPLENHIQKYFRSVVSLKILQEASIQENESRYEIEQILKKSKNELANFRANIVQIREHLTDVN